MPTMLCDISGRRLPRPGGKDFFSFFFFGLFGLDWARGATSRLNV